MASDPRVDALLHPLERLGDEFCPEVVIEILRKPENDSPFNNITADLIEGLSDEVQRLRWIESKGE